MQAVVSALLADLRPEGSLPSAPSGPLSMSSDLQADLGLDSLDRVELLARVEEAFGVRLPDRVLETATTPAAWLDAVQHERDVTARRGATHPAPEAASRRPPPAGPGGRPMAAPAAPTAESTLVTAELGEAATLVESLVSHARTHPDRRHLRLRHADGAPDGTPQDLTYGDLLGEALGVAQALADHGLVPGERVGLMLPTVRSFFPLFAGILAAGAVAVPIYPPSRPDQLEAHLLRQAGILSNAGVALLVTNRPARRLGTLLRLHVPTLRATIDVDDLTAPGRRADAPPTPTRPDDLAMLQYTSGSTGDPKGVMLTHRQLLANLNAMGAAAQPEPDDVFVSWLPLYHDMGLIGAWMAGLHLGFASVIMSPISFLSRPARWLRVISEEGGTISAAPNFAYDLCTERARDEELDGVDLSAWRIAMNGAEPVRAETLARFTERFHRFGLRAEAMAPVYGMAEVGLGITFTPPGRGPLVDEVDAERLASSGQAGAPGVPGAGVLAVVSCGRPLPGYTVRVVRNADDGRDELPERSEGRIECCGPSVTDGYFGNPAATADLFDGPWLDTGDLGYLADGELYLTGRAKDLVIRAGRNIHPEEIEAAAGTVPGVRTGCVAAFALGALAAGASTEQLVVVAETRLREPAQLDDLRRAVTARVVDATGSPPDVVVLAPPGSVLKTSSGKIRRSDTRQRYEAGHIAEGGPRRTRTVGVQVAALVAGGIGAWAARWRHRGAILAFGCRAWGAVLVLGVPTWLCVLVLPGRSRRWRVLRRAGSALCSAVGIDLTVEHHHRQEPPQPGGAVIVANHASFVDSLALLLAIPGPLTFTAGGTLASQRVAGPFLRRLGAVFVGTDDPRRATASVATLSALARAGETLVFFPEGGLSRQPGLRRFHLGAFLVALDTAVPVVPVAIRGSRQVVPPGRRLPHQGSVEVVVGPPILHQTPEEIAGDSPPPGGEGASSRQDNRWAAALALQFEARRWIADHCGEPDTTRAPSARTPDTAGRHAGPSATAR